MIAPLGPNSTAAIFVPMPGAFLNSGHLILCELLGDIIFMFILQGILDARNRFIDLKFVPVLVSLDLIMVAGCFGWYIPPNFILCKLCGS